MRLLVTAGAIAFVLFTCVSFTHASPPEGAGTKAATPGIAGASDEARKALPSFQIPEGWKGAVYAAEPLVVHPVAFHLDYQNRLFVAETFRQKRGVEDNRSHPEWLDDDLAAQTLEDRLAYFKKHLKDGIKKYEANDDRIQLVLDTDNDGVADKVIPYANGFNGVLAGTGAGVLSHRGSVYYTCIPHLWKLTDNDGDGKSDSRESLSYGYGVRVAFRGHDSHGLTVGPQGRIYYSIGDRGYHIKHDGKLMHDPASGAVFRCEADGSNLEVFATGLRNPQELAFDEYGNLFTGDNNSDSGDKARWVYVLRGGDSGWRMYYQYLPDRGPFNREKIWHPHHEGQPAYVSPPVANFADGPSGLAYYPGTGLGEEFNGRFLLCDFRGASGKSGIRSLRVKPKGASFEMVDTEQPFWKILATDVQFGHDGAIYISDWVHGWEGVGKGRIYRFADPKNADSPVVKEVAALLSSDMTKLDSKKLVALLGHADQRVRQSAQFALVDQNAIDALTSAAQADDADGKSAMLAKIHGLWGLRQIARTTGNKQAQAAATNAAAAWLSAAQPELRAQGAASLGALNATAYAGQLINSLKDSDARVRYFAAIALGDIKAKGCVPAVLEMLTANASEDPALRHAGVMALVGAGDEAALLQAATNPSIDARLAVVVALRRMQSARVAIFLNDEKSAVATEAARAIHDVPLNEALPALAAALPRSGASEPFARRALSANFQLGTQPYAAAVARFAVDARNTDKMRIEALQMLAAWSKPSPKNRVHGRWNPLEPRSEQIAATAVRKVLPGIATATGKVQEEGLKTAAKLGVKEIAPALLKMLADTTQSGKVRGDALVALASIRHPETESSMQSALKSELPALRAAALKVYAAKSPADAMPLLKTAVLEGPVELRQPALAVLKTTPGSDKVLAAAMEQLLADKFPAGARLDVLEAAAAVKKPSLKSLLEKYQSSLDADDPLSAYKETLVGGDAERGRRIFFEKAEVSCVRCHKSQGVGGDVGPELTKVAADKQRLYLLESIVTPNKVIAKGFESALIVTGDGEIVTGVVKSEDDDSVTLQDADGKLIEIEKDNIEEREASKSGMPDELAGRLTRQELRDLVEYLSTLK